jgi:hypothetical protein
LIEPVANWDVEISDLAVVERVAVGGLVEGILIVEDALFEVVDLVLVPLRHNSGGGLPVGDGLKEPISNTSK